MKKILSILLIMTMMFSLAACSSDDSGQSNTGGTDTEQGGDDSTGETSEPYMAKLLVNGNLGDKSFFDSATAGLTALRDELGEDVFDFDVEELGGRSEDAPKYEPAMLDACDSGEYDVIIVGTWQMVTVLENAAKSYPDQKFIMFDEYFNFETNGNPTNVYNVQYKQNEVSFLVGAAAALMTQDASLDMVNPDDKLIGFLGGQENAIIQDFLVGFIQGAQHVDPETKVAIAYVGSFVDSVTGKDLALTQYNNGVDVGYNVAGGSGLGQIEAAAELGKYAFGVDSDQAALLPDMADHIPTSAIKNVGNSLIRAIKLDLEGNLAYGEGETLGFAEDGVAIVKDAHYEAMVPESIRATIETLEQEIIDGTIVVNTSVGKTTEEVDAMIAPALQ